MKNIIRSFALVAILLSVATMGYAQPKPASPAAQQFTGSDEELGALIAWGVPNRADNHWWWHGGAEAAQDVFVTELVSSGRFRMMKGDQMLSLARTKLAEMNLTFGQNFDTPTARRVGQMMGVKYLLAGAITEYGIKEEGAGATVTGRLIDTSTGEIVWADEVRVSVGGFGGGVDDQRMFDRVVKPAIQQLVGKLTAARK